MTARYVVSVHLPAVATGPPEGLAVIITPSGVVERRVITSKVIEKRLDSPLDYAADLIGRMYPAVKNKIIDVQVNYTHITDTSAMLIVVSVVTS